MPGPIIIPSPNEVAAFRDGRRMSSADLAELLNYGDGSRIREFIAGGKRMSGPAAALFWLLDDERRQSRSDIMDKLWALGTNGPIARRAS